MSDEDEPLLVRGTKRPVACRKEDFAEEAWERHYKDVIGDRRRKAAIIGGTTMALITSIAVGAGFARKIRRKI